MCYCWLCRCLGGVAVGDLQTIGASNQLAPRKYGASWHPVLQAKLLAAIC